MSGTPTPILVYHSVTASPPADLWRWSVAPEDFARHLDAVVASGRVPFTVSDYAAARAAGSVPERAVVITFDDGYADFATNALALLAERALPATLYVTTGGLGAAEGVSLNQMPVAPMLAPDDLAALAASGIEIGAHSVTHPELDAIGPERARVEIEQSKAELEALIGHEVASFAYPHGYSGPAVRRLVRAAGYRSACGVRNAFSTPEEDVMALSRLMVERDMGLDVITGWLAGRGAPLAAAGEARRTQVYRWYRRARHATSTLVSVGAAGRA